jgi:hypothetical protein
MFALSCFHRPGELASLGVLLNSPLFILLRDTPVEWLRAFVSR